MFEERHYHARRLQPVYVLVLFWQELGFKMTSKLTLLLAAIKQKREAAANDKAVAIIHARMSDEFVSRVNNLLSLGNWRIVQTEMSVCDHQYDAMLIESKDDLKIKKEPLIEMLETSVWALESVYNLGLHPSEIKEILIKIEAIASEAMK